MIFPSSRVIFVHVPKTAGNTIQRALIDLSPDQLITSRHQDGEHRFEIKGNVTPHKHATLQDYRDRLCESYASYRTMIGVRHPFERFTSWFFSPHRWYIQSADGNWRLDPVAWTEDNYRSALASGQCRPIHHFIRVDGVVQAPDAIIRYERFASDFKRAIQQLGMTADVGFQSQRRINTSAASKDEIRKVLGSAHLRDLVETHYAQDMELFGYDSYSVSTLHDRMPDHAAQVPLK